MNKPLVSIIIPTYNRAHILGETLDSVIALIYQNWECIVVDDGSNDYTDELMEFYCKKDIRIQYHHRPSNKPKGANACRNYGFEVCNGRYINWLDSDDLLAKNKISVQIKDLIENNSELAICKFGYKKAKERSTIRKNLEIYRTYNSGKQFLKYLGLHKEYLPPHCYLISRRLVDASKFWNEDLIINQDGEFFSRVLNKVGKVVFSETYVLYRFDINNNNVSFVNSEEKALGVIRSWQIIEKNLKNSAQCKPYVMNAKRVVFKKLYPAHKDLVVQNLIFFKPIIPLKVWLEIMIFKLRNSF